MKKLLKKYNYALLLVFFFLIPFFSMSNISVVSNHNYSQTLITDDPKTSSSDYFMENFETMTYKDDANSNVSGWGSGDIYLPQVNITQSHTFLENCGINIADLFVDGDIAYIGGAVGTFVYNVSNPNSPILLDYNTTVNFRGYRYYAVDGYLFITASTAGVRVINVTDPSNIQFVTSYDGYEVNPSFPDNVWADTISVLHEGSNWYIYIMDDYHGFVSLQYSKPNTITQTGGYDPSISGNALNGDLIIQGDLVYASLEALLIMNISNRVNPSFVKLYQDESVEHMDLQGDLIYFEDASMGTGYSYGYFKILNISNPLTPTIVYSTPDLGHNIAEVTVLGDLACLGYSIEIATDTFEPHYDVYNISDSSNPIQIYSYISPFALYVPSGWFFGVTMIFATSDYWYLIGKEIGDEIRYLAIEDFNLIGAHETDATAQSLDLFSNANTLVENVTLISNATVPLDTSIQYYISANNGSIWEQVFNNTPYQVTQMGSELKWKAELSTTNINKTPTVYSIEIYYTYLLKAVNLTLPLNNSDIYDNTPYFEWTTISGADTYLLQIDNLTTFDSPYLRNISAGTNNYFTLTNPLENGIWYWRVAAFDSEGDLGLFTDYFNFSLYALPYIISLDLPINNAVINSNYPTFNWISSIDTSYHTIQIDITPLFNSGYLREANNISINQYTPSSSLFQYDWYWRVRPYNADHASGPYSLTSKFTIDTTAPIIDNKGFSSFTINEGEDYFQCEWEVYDANPGYYVIFKDNKEIESKQWSGENIKFDPSSLSPGKYEINCTVYDLAGNFASDVIEVNVNAVESGGNANYFLPIFGIILIGSISAAIFIYLRKFKK